MYNFELGKTYSFNTLAPAVLGVRVTEATLVGIVDYQQACTMLNVDLTHRQIYPLLPAGTPNNTQKYIYYVFRMNNGSKIVMASVWIEESSIELYVDLTMNVSIPGVTLSDVTKIRDALNLMGYRGFTITTQ